jgi:hypothetical protein
MAKNGLLHLVEKSFKQLVVDRLQCFYHELMKLLILLESPTRSEMKEGPSLSSRAQGGVFSPLKIKKTKYYEIRRQGKTKLSLKYFENKLKFNLKKREFTLLGLSLALLALHSPPLPPPSLFRSFALAHDNQPQHRTPQQLPIASTSSHLHQ